MQGSQQPLEKKEELWYRQSQGRPHLFVDMRIVNDQGAELPWDGKATGEVQVRGPHVIQSYFRVLYPELLMHAHLSMFQLKDSSCRLRQLPKSQ